jgi:hypothetical protein
VTALAQAACNTFKLTLTQNDAASHFTAPCAAQRLSPQVQLTPDKQGSFTVAVHPDWAPKGAARFLELVDSDFFSDVSLV